jgi:hypothetical protein
MSIVLSFVFALYHWLLDIIYWVELEVPLDISFACYCSLKIELLIICITTCYFHRSNKLQSSCLVLSSSYSRTSMGQAWGCRCMQNSCMNFVVYWCILQHIKMLLDVIIMFCIDLWGFSIDPPYFGYNSPRQENLFYVFWCFRNLPELNFA